MVIKAQFFSRLRRACTIVIMAQCFSRLRRNGNYGNFGFIFFVPASDMYYGDFHFFFDRWGPVILAKKNIVPAALIKAFTIVMLAFVFF